MSADTRREWSQLLGLLARLFVGGLFVYAASSKAVAPQAFVIDIANYRLLPKLVLPFVAVTLPWIEMLCGVGLLLGWKTRANALIATGLLLVFLYGAIHAIRNGINIDCGCFGSTTADPKNPIDGYTVLRDLGFIFASVVAMVAPSGQLSIDGWLARRAGERQRDPRDEGPTTAGATDAS
ncbi:MAG: DoxX family membrane protein [Myxococcales bacterium]|nr:DoxX family membrane protein [Myxococcales bacterium]